jgi:hypothetical protein
MRAEDRACKRLNPRKEDLHRWRETFTDRLRDWRALPALDPACSALVTATHGAFGRAGRLAFPLCAEARRQGVAVRWRRISGATGRPAAHASAWTRRRSWPPTWQPATPPSLAWPAWC